MSRLKPHSDRLSNSRKHSQIHPISPSRRLFKPFVKNDLSKTTTSLVFTSYFPITTRRIRNVNTGILIPPMCYRLEQVTDSPLFSPRNSARSSIDFVSLLYFPPLQKMTISLPAWSADDPPFNPTEFWYWNVISGSCVYVLLSIYYANPFVTQPLVITYTNSIRMERQWSPAVHKRSAPVFLLWLRSLLNWIPIQD